MDHLADYLAIVKAAVHKLQSFGSKFPHLRDLCLARKGCYCTQSADMNGDSHLDGYEAHIEVKMFP